MFRGKYYLSSNPEAAPVLDLRKRIPEFAKDRDVHDDMAFYALVYNEADEPSACGRLYIDDDSRFRLDYIGVLPEERHKYMGDLVARMMIYKAEELNAPRIVADVPKTLVYFFARYGFRLDAMTETTAHMSVERENIRLEGSCSKGDGSACIGDCANCN